jgi:hypothetical protein
MMKKILGLILGAGSGLIGTFIRVVLAGIAGYFVNKGFIDSATAGGLVDQLAGVALGLLAALGSYLNNEVKAPV